MPLNQYEQKRAILHVRARAFEDAAREISVATTSGVQTVAQACETLRSFARSLREDADSTFSSLQDRDCTVDSLLKRYATMERS